MARNRTVRGRFVRDLARPVVTFALVDGIRDERAAGTVGNDESTSAAPSGCASTATRRRIRRATPARKCASRQFTRTSRGANALSCDKHCEMHSQATGETFQPAAAIGSPSPRKRRAKTEMLRRPSQPYSQTHEALFYHVAHRSCRALIKRAEFDYTAARRTNQIRSVGQKNQQAPTHSRAHMSEQYAHIEWIDAEGLVARRTSTRSLHHFRNCETKGVPPKVH